MFQIQRLLKPGNFQKRYRLVTSIACILIVVSSGHLQEIDEQANRFYKKGVQAKSLSEKIKYLKKAVQLEPVFKKAVFELGKTYYQKGHYEQAIVQLTQTLHLDSASNKSVSPYLRNAHTFFAGDLNENSHYQLALKNVEQALKIDEKYAPALTVLGSIYFNLGDFPAGIWTLEKSVALKPNQEFAWKKLGDLYLQTEEYGKAIFAYEQALHIDPKIKNAQFDLETARRKNSPEAWLARADEAVGKNDPDAAFRILTKANFLYPGDELIAGKLDSLTREHDYQNGLTALENRQWSMAFEIFQGIDAEFRQTTSKLEEAKAELLFQENDSLVTQEVVEKLQPDSLISRTNVFSKEKDQPASVQQSAGKLSRPEPEPDPETLEEPLKSDSVAILSDTAEAAKLEPSPAIPEAEPGKVANSSHSPSLGEFSVPPAIKVKPPKIITIPEVIGITGGILILSFLLVKLKNNFKTATIKGKLGQNLAVSETGFVRAFARKRELSKQTEALFQDEVASDTHVSFNPVKTREIAKNENDFEQTPGPKAKPGSRLLSWLETKTILGGIKKVRRIGRYIIEKEIARGTMGRVYKAWDPKLDRTVVIKQMAFDFSGSSPEFNDLKNRLYREARAAGRLNHPNIVTIYDVDEEHGFCFIVMEYLDGEDLRVRLERQGKIKLNSALNIFGQICDALDYAHRNGIVHRDIKPSNILITKNDHVKVADFGIAKLPQLGTLTQTGNVLGTPFYMSPEQIEDRHLDGRSDIFSAGVVLYEMLTGVRPFDGDSIPSLVYKIIHKIPNPPSMENGDLSDGIDRIIERALTKDPKKRFATAKEFFEAFEKFQGEAARDAL
ncbi:protein kinase [candidate division KSB1 bacterium]|nr:protein kinase [candidate division KSB1 bacterium]